MVDSSNSSLCVLPYSSSVAIATVNAIFCVLGIIGNSLVMLAVYTTLELRSLTYFYLVALAITDFLTSAIAQPLLIVLVIEEGKQECNIALENAFRSAGNFFPAVSFLILLFITTERLLAALKPILYKSFHPKRRFVIFISISTILSLLYTILRLAVSKKATSYISAIILVLGYIYIVACYLIILLQLRRQKKKMKTPTTSGEENTRSTRRAEKLVTSTMALIIVIFTIMWGPFFYYRISQPSNNSGAGYNWVRTTAISNSALNFIVYAFRMKRFRNAFRNTIASGYHTMFPSRTSSIALNG